MPAAPAVTGHMPAVSRSGPLCSMGSIWTVPPPSGHDSPRRSPAAADPPGHRGGTAPERFLDWRMDCPEGACAISTRVLGAGGREVLRLGVSGAGERALVIATPLPLFLPDGVDLALGAGIKRQVPWRSCSASSGTCEARLPLDAETLAALRRERGGTVTLTLIEDQPVRIGFSLMGFTGALRALGPAAVTSGP